MTGPSQANVEEGRDGTDAAGDEALRAFSLRTLAPHTAEDAAEGQKIEPWVLCDVQGKEFAISLHRVVEVFGAEALRPPPPGAPASVTALAEGGGLRVPVVNLGHLLAGASADDDTRNHVLVVSTRGRHIGLKVDRVRGIVALETSRIQAVPAVLAAVSRGLHAIAGFAPHGKRWLLLLDIEGLLSPERAPS